jgi:pantoate--beta-alanine ligase
MEIIVDGKEMQRAADALRARGDRIGLVPTMGYLHDAHIQLVRQAKALTDVVVVSIFVNPTQFGPGEDFERYPRDEEGDRIKLEREGVQVLFAPETSRIYPPGYQTFVEVTEVSSGLCGDFRPGHFRGVATVVAKLFNIVKPHVAVFGEKDYQQLLVLRRMVEDLQFDVDVVSGELVREEDGLAMSSRNVYLSSQERERARVLFRSLNKGKEIYESGEKNVSRIKEAVREAIVSMEGVDLQYVELRDAVTLEEIDEIQGPAVIAVAAVVGPSRLIDNIIIGREKK